MQTQKRKHFGHIIEVSVLHIPSTQSNTACKYVICSENINTKVSLSNDYGFLFK